MVHEQPGVGDRRSEQPEYFADLNLDQVVEALVRGREEYDLRPFLYVPLHTIEEVEYRQRVLADLEDAELVAAVRAFADGMRQSRGKLARAQRFRSPDQRASGVCSMPQPGTEPPSRR